MFCHDFCFLRAKIPPKQVWLSFLPRLETRGYFCSTPSGFRIIIGLCAKIYRHGCFMFINLYLTVLFVFINN